EYDRDDEGPRRKRRARDVMMRLVARYLVRPPPGVGVARARCTRWTRLVPVQRRLLAGVAALAGTGVDHAKTATLLSIAAMDEPVRVGDGRVNDPGQGEATDERDGNGETKSLAEERPHADPPSGSSLHFGRGRKARAS